MFNFMKDIYLEMNGIDPEAARKEKSEEKTIDKVIFSFRSKVVIWIMGIIYLIITVPIIIFMIKTGINISIFKYILLMVMDILILICISIKKKTSEVIALATIICFVIINFVTI